MKKLMIMMSLVLMTCFCGYALTANEIIGKWESSTIKPETDPDDPMKMSIKLVYDFAADNSASSICKMDMSIMLDHGIYADIFMEVACKGNYEVAGDSISVNYTPGSQIVTLTEDDIRVRGIEDEEMATQVKEAMFAQFSQQKEAFTAEIGKEPDVLNNVMVTGNKMIANLDDEIVTFKRKKK